MTFFGNRKSKSHVLNTEGQQKLMLWEGEIIYTYWG